MTATIAKTHTILGEEFDTAELQGIARYGADTGVHGFTYSSDLHDLYEEHEDELLDWLEGIGYSIHEVFSERKFDTLQQFKEWVCWAYLEYQAQYIVEG